MKTHMTRMAAVRKDPPARPAHVYTSLTKHCVRNTATAPPECRYASCERVMSSELKTMTSMQNETQHVLANKKEKPTNMYAFDLKMQKELTSFMT